MSTTATLGNALLKRGDGNSPEAFTTLYEVTSIGDFGETSDLVEVTHMLSTQKEFIHGLADGSEFTVTTNYLYSTSTHAALVTDVRNKTARNFQLFLPNLSVKFYFSALVRSWNLTGLTPNTAMNMVFGFKLTGGVTGPN